MRTAAIAAVAVAASVAGAVAGSAAALPGAAVDSVIPSADEASDFAVSFTLTDDGRLAAADVTGPFYGSEGDVDYRLEVSDYGTEKDITAP